MTTTTERVMHYLGTCDMNRARRTDTARALAMSKSTLSKRLRGEGTSFSTLQRQERINRTERLLKTNPKIGAKRLAAACGYATVNAFYRALPSWAGRRYTDYRQQI